HHRLIRRTLSLPRGALSPHRGHLSLRWRRLAVLARGLRNCEGMAGSEQARRHENRGSQQRDSQNRPISAGHWSAPTISEMSGKIVLKYP
ncbi:MAG TPA: hypothetical protein VMD92_12130, partial [Acidobacteriaceae bacterium]|nr:hypothetical protein [Acidobacteriaceae bacterium]